MIHRLHEFSSEQQKKITAQIREVFFEASNVKTFRDEEHRESFFFRWCGVYLQDDFPSPFLAIQKGKLLGYLIYSLKTPLQPPWGQPGVECFEDLYELFPSHLHMNCQHEARGKGVGSKLIYGLTEELRVKQIPGVHIITSPDQANVEFYRKVGFLREELRERAGYNLLFMGKKISRSGGERENPTSRSH